LVVSGGFVDGLLGGGEEEMVAVSVLMRSSNGLLSDQMQEVEPGIELFKVVEE